MWYVIAKPRKLIILGGEFRFTTANCPPIMLIKYADYV